MYYAKCWIFPLLKLTVQCAQFLWILNLYVSPKIFVKIRQNFLFSILNITIHWNGDRFCIFVNTKVDIFIFSAKIFSDFFAITAETQIFVSIFGQRTVVRCSDSPHLMQLKCLLHVNSKTFSSVKGKERIMLDWPVLNFSQINQAPPPTGGDLGACCRRDVVLYNIIFNSFNNKTQF
jgi:hypothetical protein